MGLVFQSRAFIRSSNPDLLATFAEPHLWEATGRGRTFLHFCQEGKSSSFAAAQATYDNLKSLGDAFGFFSLTADHFDHPDCDRAYVLDRGTLREVDTSAVADPERTPPSLYQHFEWCRLCSYAIGPDAAPPGTAAEDPLRWVPASAPPQDRRSSRRGGEPAQARQPPLSPLAASQELIPHGPEPVPRPGASNGESLLIRP